VACAAALTTLRLLKDQYLDNARVQGERLMAGVKGVMSRRRILGDVRGLGLMLGAEIVVPDTPDLRKDAKRRDAIVEKAFQRGLLLLGCGDNTVRFCPPLVVTSEEIDTCLRIFEEAVAEVESQSA
jgi:4-aminobutyrate aminotransferase